MPGIVITRETNIGVSPLIEAQAMMIHDQVSPLHESVNQMTAISGSHIRETTDILTRLFGPSSQRSWDV